MLTDDDLLQSALRGDATAFGDLFDRHADAIHAYAMRRTHNADTAQEILSATFLEAWKMRDRVVAVDGELLPWLYGIARNHVRHHWRSRKRKSDAYARFAGLAATETADHADDIAATDATRQLLDATFEALEQLDETARELLTLSVWEGLSYRDIAAAMSLPIGTVQSKLSRARAELKRIVRNSR